VGAILAEIRVGSVELLGLVVPVQLRAIDALSWP